MQALPEMIRGHVVGPELPIRRLQVDDRGQHLAGLGNLPVLASGPDDAHRSPVPGRPDRLSQLPAIRHEAEMVTVYSRLHLLFLCTAFYLLALTPEFCREVDVPLRPRPIGPGGH